jgi:hypothetical protein
VAGGVFFCSAFTASYGYIWNILRWWSKMTHIFPFSGLQITEQTIRWQFRWDVVVLGIPRHVMRIIQNRWINQLISLPKLRNCVADRQSSSRRKNPTCFWALWRTGSDSLRILFGFEHRLEMMKSPAAPSKYTDQWWSMWVFSAIYIIIYIYIIHI